MKDTPPVNRAWAGVIALALRDGVTDLTKRPDPIFRRKIGDLWNVTVNGGKKPYGAAKLPQFAMAIEYNGWPAGIIDPAGGIIAAGEAANEDALIAAIEQELGCSIEDALAGRQSNG